MNKEVKTIDELARMVARGFESVEEKMATKEDLAQLREEMQGGFMRLREDIDIMLDRHIKTFRKAYDELAARVKKLEEAVFQRV